MQALMKNPAMVLPDGVQASQNLSKVANRGGVESETLELVHLRASQINGCSACVGFVDEAKRGAMGDRLWLVSAWREAPYYTDAERTALELTEAMTRLADRSRDVVSDELWTELSKHYTEEQLAGLIFWIATTNFYNRLNTAVRQPAGPASWD
ncbi:carboxymuconolactone decarboxylase family protein [Actinophytocola sp.]|uniref:carboxymuconolactone decarboxylase family protein n=1 Tax=Actinophytocola sp. TaxID=1872138 RepID=UPI003D6A56F5